jgi:SAM-dependent methyltransferase
MQETTSGARAVLSRPRAYELWSQLVGAERSRNILVSEHVRPWPGARVLDLGCGPGELLRFLGDVSYVGVDTDDGYIERARALYADRAEFRVGDATAVDHDLRGFDLVLAFGLLHHLDDDSAAGAFQNAAAALKPDGRFVGVDPAISDGQPWLARLLISWDRGNHARTPSGYAHLARPAMKDVQTLLRTDLLRIPYSHCILEARKG